MDAPARRWLFSLLLLVAGTAVTETSVWVVPAADVVNGVNVRAAPGTDADFLASLRPGERLPLTGSVPFWYEVSLDGDRRGFVSKRWTELLEVPAPIPDSLQYELHAIDVGTGLAVLVRGRDFALLYDGGSNDDLGLGEENRLLAYLRAAAPDLAVIDHLVLSHPHRDHVELLADVLAEYQVREIWDSGARSGICGYRAFIEAAALEEGARFHVPALHFGTAEYHFPAKRCRGVDLEAAIVPVTLSSRIDDARVEIGQGAAMRFLHASEMILEDRLNESSLVLRLELGDRVVLLTGDAEAGGRDHPATPPRPDSVEGKLLACCLALLRADVLVVGHHGSKTSSRRAFLDAVGASHYLVSSGPTKYGTVVLPDLEVIEELEARGVVLRTDVEDEACRLVPVKIGGDADGRPGGCSNVVMRLKPGSPVEAALSTVVD